MVQYCILAWSANHPSLTKFTDNMSLLDSLAEQDLFKAEDAKMLKQAYCQFRDRGHKEALQGNKAIISQDELVEKRQQVAAIWQALML